MPDCTEDLLCTVMVNIGGSIQMKMIPKAI